MFPSVVSFASFFTEDAQRDAGKRCDERRNEETSETSFTLKRLQRRVSDDGGSAGSALILPYFTGLHVVPSPAQWYFFLLQSVVSQ